MILGHFGFALISFSITMNTLLQSEMDFTGRVGTSKTFNEFKVTFKIKGTTKLHEKGTTIFKNFYAILPPDL